MARSFKSVVSIDDQASASSEALRLKVTGEANARLSIDAGGKLTWGSGSASGDATLYRSAANALKTDDTFQAALGVITLTTDGAPSSSLADGAVAVDTTNDSLYFRSSSNWQAISNLIISDGVPSGPVAGDLWFESDTGRTFVYYADGSSNQWIEIGSASSSGVSGAAGKVQFSEGNTFASDTLLHWDNTNNRLGVGTASPAVPLHVASGSSGATAHSYTGLIVESDERAAISILTPTNMDGFIYFGDPEANNVGRITYGHGSNVFVFTTNGYDRMAIDGSGNVGIGDTSPDSKLHIANGDIRISGGTSGNSNKIIFKAENNDDLNKYICTTSYWMELGVAYDGGLRVKNSSGTNIFQISGSSGNVGIGTTSPTHALHVNGTVKIEGASSSLISNNTGSGREVLQVRSKSSTTDGAGFNMYGDGDSSHASKTFFYNDSSTPTMTMLPSGNVGIGTSSPSYLLHLSGTDPILRIDETATDDDVKLQLMQSGSNTEGTELKYESGTGHTVLKSIYSGGHMYFQTAGANNRMTITNAGKVGIGTTAPNNLLSMAVPLSGLEGLAIQYGTETKAGLLLNPATGEVRVGALNSTGDYFVTLYADNAEAMRIDKDGNVGIGTTSPAAPLSFANATGQKIDFYYTTGSGGDRYGIQVQSSELRIHSGALGASTGGITFGKQTTSAFTENMRITNAGNVGIGTSGPTCRFQVAHPGTSAQGYFEGGWANNLNSNSRLTFTDHNFGIGAGQIGSGSNEDHLVLWGYNGAGRGVSIKGTSNGAATTFQSMDKWATFTHHTWGPRLTLYGSGTTEGGELALAGGSSYGNDLYIDRHDNTLRMIYNAASVFQIASNGNVANVNNSYTSLSDERLKTDIEPARDYLADLLNLEVVNFIKDKQFLPTRIPVLDDDGNPTYRPVPVLDDEGNMTYDADGMPITTNGDAISDPSPTEGAFEALDEPGIKQLGLIAQQVEPYLPGLIEEDRYGVKALKYSVLVPMLLQAVQTLTARVTELESA